MYPFLRRSERPRDPNREQQGIRITYPNNVCHWFPGSEQTALAVARSVCPSELLNHSGTTVEAGLRCGTIFVLQRHIAGPVLSKTDEEGPRVIAPDSF